MRVGIFYFSLNPAEDRQKLMVGATPVFIRVTTVHTSTEEEALDLASPRPDESVMNTHDLEG